MAYLAVNKSFYSLDYNREKRIEVIFQFKPYRENERWFSDLGELSTGVFLPKGSIKRLIGKEMNWEDEPIKI